MNTPLVILGPGGDFRRTYPAQAAIQAEIDRRVERHEARCPSHDCPTCDRDMIYESEPRRHYSLLKDGEHLGWWTCPACGTVREHVHEVADREE